jgi:hypothetical protein
MNYDENLQAGKMSVAEMYAFFRGAFTELAQNFKSATEPNPAFARMWWPDEATGLLKQRNADNTDWIIRGKLDEPYFGLVKQEDLAGLADRIFNPGDIWYFARATPRPGWIEANGALLLRADYPDLWAEAQASGNLVSEEAWSDGNFGSYSTGDESTTFRIPELRDYFIRGLAAGRSLGSYQNDSFQGHKFDLYAYVTLTGSSSGADHYRWCSGNENRSTRVDGSPILGPLSDGTNGTPRIASETRPKNIALLVCIKT